VTSSHELREDGPPSILIVDDDEDLRELLVLALRSEGPLDLEEAGSAGEARAILSRRGFDVVITDLSMPDESGLTLMQWSLEHCPGPCWIVLTGYGTFDTAVKALQLGAFDFLSKPIRPIEPLRNAVRNALARQRLIAERDRLHVELQDSNDRLRSHVEQLEEACHLLRQQAETIRADLQRAGIIQQALLPQFAPPLASFHINALYRPSPTVGGDLYDVFRVDERHIALLVADAAGHGLSAAMLAVLFRSRLPILDPDTHTPRDPRAVLRDVNRSLCEALPGPGLFLTATYCLLDAWRGHAIIASAGHPPLLWVKRDGRIERIYHTGPALGLSPDADFAQQRIAFEPGESVLFYSDGLYEQFPSKSGSASDAIADALDLEAQTGADMIEPLLAPYRGVQQDGGLLPQDDVTVLLLTAEPGASVLDHGAPLPMPRPRTESSGIETLVGADPRRTTLSIHGRGDWSHSAAFYAECSAAIEASHDVMVDLSLCRLLDSTFLGTIHLLCESADRADVEFRLQGVMPEVEELFQELGMANVMEHIVPRMLPLPTTMVPVGATEADPSTRALLLLRAHEGLAALSDRNRQEFDPLVTQLRQELATLSR
jgi:serine phosphatase RsbU (regulator of sigma subunit)/anti-anti-sigma regulatory factor